MSKTLEYARCFAAWANECGFDLATAAEVVRLAKQCGSRNVRYSNGYPHPLVKDRDDRAANSEAWGRDFDRSTERLSRLVAPHGFSVEYNGLMPTLHKQGTSQGSSIIIPTDT